jgi:hypothetical protein
MAVTEIAAIPIPIKITNTIAKNTPKVDAKRNLKNCFIVYGILIEVQYY